MAYNLNDAGQYLWGYAMKVLGFQYSSAKIGSESFARGFEFQWDAGADQKAIREGFFHTTTTSAATPGVFSGLPSKDAYQRTRKK